MIIPSHFGQNYSLTQVQAQRTESAHAADPIAAKNSENPAQQEETSRPTNTETQHSPTEQQKLQELRLRDRETRAHEQAHLAAAGGFARGGPRYTYQRGPDGRLYAVGGEVEIDTSSVPGDPQATLEKARQIQRAALAPSEPSAQDRAVAAQAERMAVEARAELKKVPNGGDNHPPPIHTQVSGEIDNESTITHEAPTDEIHTTCVICGGRHGADAHSALTTYTSHLPHGTRSGLGSFIQFNA